LGYQPIIHDAGGSVVVTNLDSAIKAINIIVDQGEGNPGPYDDPNKEEKDHYDVFKDLKYGTQKWTVYPVIKNPTTVGYWDMDKRIYQVSERFILFPNGSPSLAQGFGCLRCGVLLPVVDDREVMDSQS
jgi:hypothetical protein